MRDTLASSGTLYTLEEELIRDLQPDLILTQQLCDVCAVNCRARGALSSCLADRQGQTCAATLNHRKPHVFTQRSSSRFAHPQSQTTKRIAQPSNFDSCTPA